MGISAIDFERLKRRVSGRARAAPELDQVTTAGCDRILGIDPSLRGTGFGIISTATGHPQWIASGTIRCPREWLRSRCLAQIGVTIREFIRQHSPNVCAVEGLFFAQNLRTAITMGEARGAALSVIAEAGLPTYEMAPRRVKQAIVGFGGAQKLAVAKMVQRLLALSDTPDADAADALALALAWFQTNPRGIRPRGKPV